MYQRLWHLGLSVIVGLALFDCHEGGETDPCQGVSCSGHGRCLSDGVIAQCECASGYRPVELQCVPESISGDAGPDAAGDDDADVGHVGDSGADVDTLPIDDGGPDGDPVDDADAPTPADGDVDGDASGDAPVGCPIDRSLMVPATDQQLVIESVNFIDDTVVVRNVTASEVALSRDTDLFYETWQLVVDSSAGRVPIPTDVTIAAGATVRFHVASDGTDDDENVYLDWSGSLGDLEPFPYSDGSEMTLVRPTDSVTDSSNIEAYVRWGDDDSMGSGASLRDEATAAGRWERHGSGAYVEVGASDSGITVSNGGRVIYPDDWTATAPEDCL